MAGRVAAGALALLLSACGGGDAAAPRERADVRPTATATPGTSSTHRPTHHQRRGCLRAGRIAAGRLRFCRRKGAYGTLRTDGGALRLQRPRGAGGWIWAAASPDGRTILVQWSGECEIPAAFLVRAAGGRPRPATPGRSNSMGLGWTTDGRAIVFVPARPGCGSGEEAGLFLVAPDGGRERVGPAAERPPFPARVRPRPRSALD